MRLRRETVQRSTLFDGPDEHGIVPHRVGFTGTRLGLTEPQRRAIPILLHRLAATQLHHGDCIGADEQAHAIAKALGLRVIGHPPKADGLRAHCDCDEWREPAPFLARNHNIVLETQTLLATPSGPSKLRSGTWSTVRYARRLELPLIVIMPDGELREYNLLDVA